MAETSIWEKVLKSSLNSDETFRKALKEAFKELRLDVRKFSESSGISESLLYKLLSGERANIRLSTLRKIIETLRKIEGIEKIEEPFVAIIAARPTLDAIEETYIEIEGKKFYLKGYAATTIEDVILASIKAEREGAKAIVCAPIVSTTVEKITRLPVASCPVMLCRAPLLKAVELAASRIPE